MVPSDLIERIEASGDARSLLRSQRDTQGVCDAFMSTLLTAYTHDPARARSLGAHWRAFYDYGDDRALAYRAKGLADRLNGSWANSAKAFQRAADLAKAEVDRFSFAVAAIDSLARAGRIEDALTLGRRISNGLEQLGRPELAARARLNTANALLWAERGSEARTLYASAIPIFIENGMRTEEAACRLGVSTTHLYGGDPAIASREAEAAREIAREEEMVFVESLCDINLAHFALVQGRADEAYSMLLDLRPRLEGSPSELARALEFAGDACLRLNLFTEASESYSAALAMGHALSRTDQAHVLLGLGEASRDEEEADRYLAKAANLYRTLGNGPWRAAAISARVMARPTARNAGRLAREALSSSGSSPYHQTLAALANAEVLLARGAEPAQMLRTAERNVRQFGFRRFAWRIHALRARSAKNPLVHYRRMVEEILRERLATTSVAARTGFLRDKSEALGAYLALLLSNPTASHVAEARDVIRRTRGATLIDEIMRAGLLELDPRRQGKVEELRRQIALDTAEEPIQDSRRGSCIHPERRAWTESTHVVGALDDVLPPEPAEGTLILTEAQGRFWAIDSNRATLLPIKADELRELVRWFHFELSMLSVDRKAPADETLSLLERLRKALVLPWQSSSPNGVRLCPDGLLWNVPWSALIDGPSTLALHPSLAGGVKVGKVERVAIWVGVDTDLSNSATEQKTLLDRFPNARVFRTRATVLDSFAEDWDLVHVIGHARHNLENPMFSALDFSDGPMFAAEIARSKLKARLACLSACETGTLSLATRDEPDGIVRAFLALGAEAVLASLWPLDDEAASFFFAQLYNSFCPCDDLSQAALDARRCVRAWRYHPYFWASISLFSGYRS